jgi:hypothetical protein
MMQKIVSALPQCLTDSHLDFTMNLLVAFSAKNSSEFIRPAFFSIKVIE